MHQDEILMVISTMRSTRYDKKFVHLHGSNKKGRRESAVPQRVDKPSLCGQRFFYAGGARGGKARLESDQMSRKALPCKACVERSDYFRAAGRHKNNDIISGCRKSRRLFDSLNGCIRGDSRFSSFTGRRTGPRPASAATAAAAPSVPPSAPCRPADTSRHPSRTAPSYTAIPAPPRRPSRPAW